MRRRGFTPTLTLLAAAALLAAGWTTPAAADTFRCGTKLAKDGDTRGAILSKCGEPTEVDQKTILRPAVIWRNGRPYRVGDGEVEVRVEIWIYNFGPNKLMRQLRFEDGSLVEINTLGYGYL